MKQSAAAADCIRFLELKDVIAPQALERLAHFSMTSRGNFVCGGQISKHPRARTASCKLLMIRRKLCQFQFPPFCVLQVQIET